MVKILTSGKYLSLLFLFLFLNACGDSGSSKVSKGHRDAIRFECKDSSDVKACSLEVRENFIEDGNEFIFFEDLSKDQIRKVQLECIRSKKFGLEAYNNCLDEYKTAALDGNLYQKKLTSKPSSSIEKLELSTV